jgi:hypothetical protein
LTVSFDQALAASPALADFSLFRKFPDGKAGLGRLRKLVLVSATYDSTTHAVTVTPRAKLPRNRFYQLVVTGEPAHSINSAPVVGSANGATAATFTYSFARGRLLRYVDQDGNHVRLQLNGPGMMVLIRNANGEGETLTLTGTTSASRLVGKVRITHLGGDGTTTLTSITGLGLARNKLTAGAFTIAGGIS